MRALTFPLMGFARHRIGTDGRGITTLAAAWGCPLQCRYCLNPMCREPRTPVRQVTVSALYQMTRCDDLYFQATGGGITFGGGEPLRHAAFISRFRRHCGRRWRITMETSLYAEPDDLQTALGCVDDFIVDIKDMNPSIYQAYTGMDNERVLQNLRALLAGAGSERVLVRVPLIHGFNTPADVQRSLTQLRRLGATRFDVFAYRVPKAVMHPSTLIS